MAERLPPEAIRGSWYWVPEKLDPKKPGDKPLQIVRFRLDGTFSRYLCRERAWEEKEHGDYTFDGSFLILRGRATDTFRVKTDEYWRWVLEGNKDFTYLLRGLVSVDDFRPMTEEDQKEVKLLPIRAVIKSSVDHDEAIFDVVFEHEGKSHPIGSFFVEREGSRLWVGVTPFVEELDLKVWERIVRESYLDMFLNKPDNVGVVTVRLLDGQESRIFNYS